MIHWSADKDGARKVYEVGGLTLTLSSVAPPKGEDAQSPEPTLTVADGQSPPFTAKGEGGFSTPAADFGVARLDPLGDGPQVVFQIFTGGAHCCIQTLVLTKRDGRWRVLDVKTGEGGAWETLPTDENGDGVVDLTFVDDRFAYSFDSFAGSWMPPAVYELVGGEVRDASTARRNRPLFERDAAEAEKVCRNHENGACAGFMADAARLGRLDWGWKIVQAGYRKDSDWPLGEKCWVRTPDGGDCPKDKTTPFADFPAALESRLVELGYIRASQARWATSAPVEPSFDCGRAKSAALKLVCATPALIAADHDMAMAYVEALAEAKDPAALKREQRAWAARLASAPRSEEHTSELQSH